MLFKNKQKKPPFNLEHHSYSQAGEDRIIHFGLFLLGINRPFYIDIGAYHPEKFNNTNIFYQSGSKGINIEPNPVQFNLFEKVRPRDINLNIGIGPLQGTLDFYEMSVATLSTFNKEEADRIATIGENQINNVYPVKVDTYQWLLENYTKDGQVDLLDIDIEGADKQFIESLNLNFNRPKIICIETLNYTEDATEKKDLDLIDLIKSKGFFYYADTYINSIFISLEDWRKRSK